MTTVRSNQAAALPSNRHSAFARLSLLVLALVAGHGCGGSGLALPAGDDSNRTVLVVPGSAAFDAGAGLVQAPGATIISQGTSYDGSAGAPADTLVGIVKDGHAYLYHPALGNVQLSDETSRKAVGAFMLEGAREDSSATSKSLDPRRLAINESSTLSTGVTIRRINDTTFEASNAKRRWVAIKCGGDDGPVYIAPRSTFLTVNVSDWADLYQADFRTSATEQFTVQSDTIETFGAVQRAVLQPIALPFVVSKALTAYNEDPSLFIRLNALDFEQVSVDGVFKILGGLESLSPVPDPGRSCIKPPLRRALVGAFESLLGRVITGDQEIAAEFADSVSNDFSQDVAGCMCEQITAGGCLVVTRFLDILSAGSWIIDDALLGAWDTVRNDAYARLDICSSGVTLSADRTTINYGESTRLYAALHCPNNSYLLDWEPKTGLTQETMGSTVVTVSPSATTTYSLTISGFYLSDRASDSITITVIQAPPGHLAASATADGTTLSAGESTILHAAASGGVPPYTFAWSAPGWGGSALKDPTVTPACTTTYQLSVQDSSSPPQAASASVTITVQSTSQAPAKAINLSPANEATNVPTSASVSWSNGGMATSYDVYFGTGNPPAAKGNQQSTTYVHVLSANTTYYWRIDAKNAAGTTRGDVWSFTTASSVAPPGSFTLSGSAYCNTTPPVAPAVSLNWTTSSGATSYDLYRNGSLYQAGLTGTTFDNNASVTAGQSYTYFVRAKNASGSRDSNTITVSVPSNVCASGPGSFTLSGSAYCNTTPPVAPAVSLNWTTSSGATSYDLYRNGTVNQAGLTGTTYDNNASVTAGQSYTYFVRAKNASGSRDSNTITVSVPSNVCASGPGSFTLSGSAYCNTTPPVAPAVSLNWTTSSGATSYDLYVTVR